MKSFLSRATAVAASTFFLTAGVLYAGTDTTVKGTTSNNTQASLEVTNSSDATLLYVRNDGNVGIGDATPTALLSVGSGDLLQVDSSGNLSAPTITANTNFVPDANDGAGLGTTALEFSDLFLASGAVINFNNGDVTLTHSADTLTLDGGALALGVNNLTMTGSLAATGARVTKGWFTDVESTNMPTVGGTAILTSLTAPQFTTIELGHASDTTLARVSAGLVSVEDVNVQLRKVTSTSGPGATPTIATAANAINIVHLTALAAAITSMTTNLSGTPVEGDILRIDFTDNGTARTIAWGTSFEASTVPLPTTTVISTRLDVGFIWNTVTSKWRCVAAS